MTTAGLIIRSRAYAPHNFVTPSNDFNTTWSRTNVTAASSADATVGTKWTLTEATDASPLAHSISETARYLKYVARCNSIKAKAGTKIRIVLGYSSSSGNIVNDYAVFDLSTGQVVGFSGGGPKVLLALGDGWFRCWFGTFNAAAAMDRFVMQIVRDTDVAPATYQADGSGTVLIAHAQAEYTKTGRPATYFPT